MTPHDTVDKRRGQRAPVFDARLPVGVAGFGVGDPDVEDEAAVLGNVLGRDEFAVGGNLRIKRLQ